MELTGNDRRTISKKLKGQEPDKVHKNTNYYELNRVIEILEEESGEWPLRVEASKFTFNPMHLTYMGGFYCVEVMSY